MSDPARAEPLERKLYRPDPADEEEIRAGLADVEAGRFIDVEAEGYLRWLAGEGPDPCPPESSG